MLRPSPPVAVKLHVVGIGASAGGLEAMLPLFARLRANGRVIYVVAQHMAKDGHDELMVRLIGRESALPVMLARDGDTLCADTVYVIPSGKDGTVDAGKVKLREPAPQHLSTPSVNALFASIAESCRSDGIGIVLSGTGSDGVAGCRALKAQEAMTIVQEPSEAKFDGMPSAAIAARVADKVLPIAAIGDLLAGLFPDSARREPSSDFVRATGNEFAPNLPADDTSAISGAERRELDLIVHQVLQATGIDFSCYKEETLLRRLDKRKTTLGIADPAAYQELIRRQPDELKTLQHLFLVSVSSFFRDRDSFRELENALIPVLERKLDGEPVRVWVPGCASGEEVYTLAIILDELLGERRSRHPVTIVGTDLNPEALAMARAGSYRQTALRETDDTLRERHFIAKGQHFEVGPELRAAVEFEQRDVLTGPPAGNLDLVSCRNLLIYMKSHLQDRLVASFQRALVPGGLLFIGQSESLGLIGNSLFAPVNHYHRLFRRRH